MAKMPSSDSFLTNDLLPTREPMAKESPAFKIKNVNLPIFVAQILTSDLASFKRQLEAQIAQAPGFFTATPMALGLSAIANEEIVPNFDDLAAFMGGLGTPLIGVVGGSEAQRQAATQSGLGLFPDTGPRPRQTTVEPAEPSHSEAPAVTTPTPVAELTATLPLPFPNVVSEAGPTKAVCNISETAPAIAHTTLIIDKPVRTGQRVYAAGANLVVLAVVNAGAELIADGDIHVYAPLRGRALAGARGDTSARIFALAMEAELVSIAGVFQLFEHGIPSEVRSKPAQVYLEGEQVVMRPLAPMR
jgi:septum site-determining protein MinC